MRRIVKMVMEMAQEHNKADNAVVTQLTEAYQFIDNAIGDVDGRHVPASLVEALVVGDFPTYFARTLSRRVYDRYAYRRGDWRDYCFMDQVPDYTTADRFRFSEFDLTYPKTYEKAEALPDFLTESRVQISVDDYSKQVDFSRRILVNDDLGAFDNIANKLGDSCRRFEDWFVSAFYDNALTQGALVVLGALYSGTGRLTTANLSIAWNAFVQRVDALGNPLNIRPRYLVIPPILRLTASQILQSEFIAELATNGINVLRGALEIKEDPYIGYVSPNIPWYLMADPNDVAGVTVARMTGMEDVRLYALAPDKIPMSPAGQLGAADWRLGSFISGDIEIQAETTIGGRNDAAGTLVGVTDANGIYYSSGTTP